MKKILLIIVLLFIFSPTFLKAQDYEGISRFRSEIKINEDSSINVKETIYYYTSNEQHGIFRTIPYRFKDKDNKKFQTPISEIKVENEKSEPINFETKKEGSDLKLKIGDANSTFKGNKTYVLSYKVNGALNNFEKHDELYWNVTGDDWDYPINNIEAIVLLPTGADTAEIQKTCYTGAYGGKEQNCTSNTQGLKITYTSEKNPLTIVTGWKKGLVSATKRKYDIQWRQESPLFWLVAFFVFIYMLYISIKKGRDPFGRGTIAPEFEAPDKLTPAQIGALIDEKADNIDISATIVSLAVNGYLTIKEDNKKFTLLKTKEADENMHEIEKEVYTALFNRGKIFNLETSGKSDEFFTEVNKIKESIYKNLTNKGYFEKNPDSVRSHYYLLSIIFFVLPIALFWLSWHLVGALVLSGIIILIFSKFMPKKTKEGVIAKEKSLGLKEFLFRADRYRLKWQEKEGIFEKFLPYAMVFGITELWAKNFKDIYNKSPEWYQGDMGTFNAVLFASHMNSFSSSASKSFSPPSTSASSGRSGFSGGGVSGGGFGGGGGGSW